MGGAQFKLVSEQNCSGAFCLGAAPDLVLCRPGADVIVEAPPGRARSRDSQL